MKRTAILVLAAACGNHLPGAGRCDAPSSDAQPAVQTIALTGTPLYFDDLRYAPDLDRVIAAPEGTGMIFLVDPATSAVTTIPAPRGVASADGKGTTLYAGDRVNRQIAIIDVPSGQVVGNAQLDSGPDYVRASPTTDEVWVTLPGASRIDIFTTAGSPITLTRAASVSIGDPEGLTFDGAGRAYTNDGGKLAAIDVASRKVIGEWSDGCGNSHGFPQADPARGLAFGGCESNGGAAVLTTSGELRAGIEAGGGKAILAYDPALHHLYLRGDGSPVLDVLGVCADGSLTTLAKLAIPPSGHGAAADEHGHAWVCDAQGGGLIAITDPFPAT